MLQNKSAVSNLRTIAYNMEGFKYGVIVGNKCTICVYVVNLSLRSTREKGTFHYTFVCIRLSSHWNILKIYGFPFPYIIAVWGTVLFYFVLMVFSPTSLFIQSHKQKPTMVIPCQNNILVSSPADCQPPQPSLFFLPLQQIPAVKLIVVLGY